jgi:hypothetical protein
MREGRETVFLTYEKPPLQLQVSFRILKYTLVYYPSAVLENSKACKRK